MAAAVNGVPNGVMTNGTSNHHDSPTVNGAAPSSQTSSAVPLTNGTTAPPSVDAKANGISPTSASATSPLKPIAIVGLSCRTSGEVTTPEQLWELCSRARSGWSEIPAERFSGDAYFHPNPSKEGCANVKGGYFMNEDVSKFDAPFFNLTEQEAKCLDPQQRILLEVVFEALETAGTPRESIVGKNVGCFMAGSQSEYENNNTRDLDTSPMYQSTGSHQCMFSNRVSYMFDLRGPSFTVETACSSSLVALHQAMLSLRSGECDSALVGACHLNLLPDLFVTMSTQQLLNDTGKSYPFDHRAVGGFARGEGAGCLLLKPLEKAIADNDVIRSVILNSGLNQDGRTNGITQPNGQAQADLIRKVYQEAGLNPADCAFAECHGTGTKVGDPIEAKAVKEILGVGRGPRQPLYIGSIKSNIGHLEGSSGLLSIVKATLMLEKGLVLPNTNYERTNSSIPLAEWNMKVATSVRPWPRGKRYVSVSNYGFGGANAHVVLDKNPLLNAKGGSVELSQLLDKRVRLYVLSASDKESLKTRMNDFGFFLEQRPEVFERALSRNVAYSLGERRSHLGWRVAIPSSSSDDLGVQLASGKIIPSRITPQGVSLGWVFTGQGAQWAKMGMELMAEYPVFEKAIKEADEHLKSLGADFSLLEELQKDAESTNVSLAHISQPACTAVQIALTQLLNSWGVFPKSTTGHSSGSIAAAYAANILDAKSSMALAYYRGMATISLKKRFPEIKGTMLAVGSNPETIRPLIKSLKSGYATVACINSPSSITVSGDVDAIDELQPLIEAKSIFNRKLRVDQAYHSEHMAKVADEYLSLIADIKPSTTSTAVYHSSLHGRVCEPSELQPEYWVANLTSPVQFTAAITSMCSKEPASAMVNTLVELGPHGALEGPVKDTLKTLGDQGKKISYVGCPLVRGKDDAFSALQLAGNLFNKGCTLDFASINRPKPSNTPPTLIIDLPRYPWNHANSFWHKSRIGEKHRLMNVPRSDIIGKLANYSNDLEPTWRNHLKTDDMPWLRQHKMQGMFIYPLSGYISQAVEAAAQLAQTRNVSYDRFDLREVVTNRPLIFEEGKQYETTITLRPYTEGLRGYSNVWDEFRICSWSVDRGWLEHCRGLVAVRQGDKSNAVDGAAQLEKSKRDIREKIEYIEKTALQPVDVQDMYTNLATIGAEFGPVFRGVVSGMAAEKCAHVDVTQHNTKDLFPKGFETDCIIHPAVLDTFMHDVWPMMGPGRIGLQSLYMPSSLGTISINRDIPKDNFHVYGMGDVDNTVQKPTSFDLFAVANRESDDPIIHMNGFTMTPIRESDASEGTVRRLCYKMNWEPAIPATTAEDVKELDTAEANAAVDNQPDDQMMQANQAASTEVSSKLEGEVKVNGVHEGEVKPAMNEQVLSITEDVVVAFTNEKQNGLATKLADAMEKILERKPTVGRLADVDATGKIMVLLELDQHILADISPEDFANIQKQLMGASGVLWCVAGANKEGSLPNSNMAIGLARTIRSETLAKIVMFDLDSKSIAEDEAVSKVIHEVFQLSWGSTSATLSSETEFALRDGELQVPRVVDDEDMNLFIHRETQEAAPYLQPFDQGDRRLKLVIGQPGALDTLHFTDDIKGPLKADEVELKVEATGMNFKDVVIAMGQLSTPWLGQESSGIVSAVGKDVTDVKIGQRIMAMSEGGYSTYARCKSTSVYPLPDDMSFEAGCTVPVVFCTAYYGLINVAHLAAGERVLIHAAAGGVGQAAVQLAHMIGAEVFATCGSPDKKKFLMDTYGIPEDRIFYSRDISFGSAIKRATQGEGVDVVLNSLAGDVLRETWDCLGHFGRFIEIGKRDITSNTRLEMARFEHNATFASVDLTVVANERPKIMKKLLEDVCALLAKATLKPIAPITTYRISEVEPAIRVLQSGKNTGKLVVIPQPGDQVKATSSKAKTDLLRADASYLIIGGTGGLGRSMAKWMAQKGARNIILVSRSGQVTDKIEALMKDLEQLNAKVVVRPCDVTNRASVENLINVEIKDLPPIRGVVQGAMVLRDVLFEKMTHEEYTQVVASKVAGTWNIDAVLADAPLDFFVCLSSVAGTVGNRGQAAYAAANVFLNGYTQYRNARGLPATSIDLTAVSNVGYLADSGAERAAEVMQNLGGEALDESEVLALLSAAISGKMKEHCNNHCITGLHFPPEKLESIFWINDAKFTYIREAAAAEVQGQGGQDGAVVPLPQSLKDAASPEKALQLLYEALIAKLSAVLMIPVEDMDPAQPITVYGLDSLVAIEIRNWITREAEANLQVLELLSSSSLMGLAQTIMDKSKLITKAAAADAE